MGLGEVSKGWRAPVHRCDVFICRRLPSESALRGDTQTSSKRARRRRGWKGEKKGRGWRVGEGGKGTKSVGGREREREIEMD